jgi:hypothetical protein
MDKPMSDLEEIVRALYESEINASISWVWDGGIAVELGDPLNGYDAEGKVSTFAGAAAWLRDQACKHYPDSEFALKLWRLRLNSETDAAGSTGESTLGTSDRASGNTLGL